MTHSATLDFSAALFGGAIALIAAFRERRSAAGWLFVAGMALLSCECAFSGMMARSFFPREASPPGRIGDCRPVPSPGGLGFFSASLTPVEIIGNSSPNRAISGGRFMVPSPAPFTIVVCCWRCRRALLLQ